MIRTTNIKNGRIDLTGCRSVTQDTFEKWTRRAKVLRDDVLLTREAPMGEVGKVNFDKPVFLGQRIVQYRVNPDILTSDYLLYSFLSPDLQYQFRRHDGGGSIVSHIRVPDCLKFEIPLPPVKEQIEIAGVLSALDAKIDCNNRMNAELESMAKTLYDYWFVQFDFPFDFAQGRPDANGQPYKSSGGKMVYNAQLKREIPAGWADSTIGETFKTYLGGTPSRERGEYWMPGEINWLSSGENPSTFVVAPDEKISNLGLLNSAAKVLPAGSVILSIVRHLRASILAIDAATNQSVVGIQESKKLKHCFVYPSVIREIPRLMALRTGAQQPHINKSVLDNTPLVIPDDVTISLYTKKAAPLFSMIQNNLQQNMELGHLRDWLLPLLMNGQVTMR